jgi:hypothetical protein
MIYMDRKKQSAKEGKFACPNSSCGFVFSKPLKVKNMSSEDSQCYDACPRCLTAIITEESVPVFDAKPDATAEDNEGHRTMESSSEEERAEPSMAVRCAHHLGYLGERGKSEKIPEDCMVCENIVKCMLKPITG